MAKTLNIYIIEGCKLAQSPLSLTYDNYILSGGMFKRDGFNTDQGAHSFEDRMY